MNKNAAPDSFATLLETAFNKSDSFFDQILPGLKPVSEAKLDALTAIFETGSVVERQLVTRLFIEHLKETGAAYLSSRLNVDRHKYFIEAAGILGALQFEPALDGLRAALAGKTPDLVLPAIKAIAMLPASRKVDEVLINFYLTFADETKISQSIRYLLPRQETLVHVMLEKYRSLDADRRMWVLKFFSETANPESLKLFGEELAAEPLERGLYCVKGLGRIGSDAAVEILKKHIDSPEWFLRKRIVEALGASNRAGAVEPLLAMLDDESVQVRAAAVESLSKVGGLLPDVLVDRLEKAGRRYKINLIRAMGQLKDEKFIKPLVEVLKDRDTLFFSIDAIGDLGSAQAEFPLRRLLKDEIWFNRLNALEALAKLRISELAQIAQEATQDENDMVRNAASRILAGIKSR